MQIDTDIFDYKHRDNTTSRVNVSEKKCSCSIYLDKGICIHLVAACILTKTNVEGIKPKKTTLRSRRRNLTKKRSLSADCITSMYTEPIQPTVSNQYEALSLEQSITPKKRGRPPKVTKALDLDHELIPKEVAVVKQPVVKQPVVKQVAAEKVTVEIAARINQKIQATRKSKRLNAIASNDSVIIESVVLKSKKKNKESPK